MNEPLVPAPPQRGRLVVTLLVFAGLFALVVLRLHDLQVEQSRDLRARAVRQARERLLLPAARGSITDALGTPLAQSLARWTLKADPTYMQDRLTATVELSAILGVPRADLRRHFESGANGRTLARNLTDEQAEQVRKLKIDHLYLERSYQRVHPQGALAAHAVGFVGDAGGGGGLEQALDAMLAGEPGEVRLERDARGRLLVPPDAPRTDAIPGAHVQLTLLTPLQRELEQSLAEAVSQHAAVSGCGIVLRPGTGEVLAIASVPTFDPDRFADDFRSRPEAFRNQAVSFVYESGSTMKPLVAGAAVADGLFRWSDRIDCHQGAWTKRIGRSARTIHSHAHGVLSVAEVVAKSDNIGMAQIGLELGPMRLHDWIVRCGFGRPTGLGLPGEDAGIVLPRSRWTALGSCMSVPMGHEIAVTPIQMAAAHAAIANRGLWQPPRLVRRIWRLDAETGREIDLPLPTTPETRRIYAAEDAVAIQAAMAMTMTDGTGKRVQLDGWSSAGKTGTTEKLVNGQYASDRHIGSFVCWAPADPDRAAELLCLVVIDDPRKAGTFGAETAAPVVQRVLTTGLELLRVPRRETGDPVAVGERRRGGR